MEDKIQQTDAKALHQSRRQMYETIDAYRRSFVDSVNGQIAKTYVEIRACPVCNSTDAHTMFIKNGGTYVKCKSCGMVYLNPVFKDEALQEYYRNNSMIQAEAHLSESDFYTSIYEKGLRSIAKFVEPGALLDIGCSSGFFLDIARQKGWATYGIELNRAEYAIAKSKGHKVWNVPMEEVDSDQKYKAVTLWDVFEHIKNGGAYLQALTKKLEVDGLVFLQIPSAASLAARILQEKCNMFDGIEHVNLYAPDTIKLLCDKSGFAILNLDTVIDELKVIKNYLNYEDPYFGDFAESSDVGFLTESLVHETQLGYKMQIVLKRKP